MAAAVGRPDAHAGEVPVAYVTLAENAAVGEGEIIEWARAHIGERAAAPKYVYIVDQIPLTSVGKIFKPALKWDAIQRAYADELSGLGNLARSVTVNVAENKIHGSSAAIHIQAADGVEAEQVKSRVAELLARYTVHYELTVTPVT